MAARTRAAAVLVAVVAALGGCGADPSPTATASAAGSPTPRVSVMPSASPTATPSPEPTLTAVDDLAPGDCFGSVEEPVGDVALVGCEEPHLHEVFAIVEHEAAAGDVFPGDGALLQYADDVCLRPFEDYVAVDYLASAYWITTLVPSESTWRDGDRRIVCALRLGEEGRETSGSARGTGD